MDMILDKTGEAKTLGAKLASGKEGDAYDVGGNVALNDFR